MMRYQKGFGVVCAIPLIVVLCWVGNNYTGRDLTDIAVTASQKSAVDVQKKEDVGREDRPQSETQKKESTGREDGSQNELQKKENFGRQKEAQLQQQVQQQQQHILDLQRQVENLHQSIQKNIPRPQQQPLPPNREAEKQRDLFGRLNKIPVKVFTRNHGTTNWDLDTEVCQTISGIGFKSAKITTKAGAVNLYIHDPKTDKHVSGTLSRGHTWEGNLVNIIISALEKSKDTAFVDIGANLGIYSLAAAKLGVKVIAIEPLKINVQRVCSSVRVGNYSQNVTIIKSALSDVYQNVTLGVDVNNIGGSFVIQGQNPSKVRASAVRGKYPDVVKTAKLDDVLQLPGFDFKRAIIKMDVEGYENKVLKGGTTFFNKVDVPVVLMEWAFHKTSASGKEIIRFFETRNYTAYDPGKSVKLHSKLCHLWPFDIFWTKTMPVK